MNIHWKMLKNKKMDEPLKGGK